MHTTLTIALPDWLPSFLATREQPEDDAARLSEVIALSAENVARGSGGPFAAAVYDEESGERLAAAVNVVIPSHCAAAHAETLALSLAQQACATHTLAVRRCVLVTSAEPCAMCLGAICWSGVVRVLYAATRADVEATGFDEGPRPARWKAALISRGIAVTGPLQRRDAAAVLRAYVQGAGHIYNG
ncbi:MAG: nucleoside deaminase [Moraxellaceae bacterium]|nr:nucleoside deaminase [Moraxellaceae bacterium]